MGGSVDGLLVVVDIVQRRLCIAAWYFLCRFLRCSMVCATSFWRDWKQASIVLWTACMDDLDCWKSSEFTESSGQETSLLPIASAARVWRSLLDRRTVLDPVVCAAAHSGLS
jgi:hypothetical protein